MFRPLWPSHLVLWHLCANQIRMVCLWHLLTFVSQSNPGVFCDAHPWANYKTTVQVELQTCLRCLKDFTFILLLLSWGNHHGSEKLKQSPSIGPFPLVSPCNHFEISIYCLSAFDKKSRALNCKDEGTSPICYTTHARWVCKTLAHLRWNALDCHCFEGAP